MAAIDSPWLTPAEAAEYAKRHPKNVSAALRNGVLPGTQAARKGRWVVHRDDLDVWVRAGAPLKLAETEAVA
jgi:hypothetical protein